MGNIKTIYSRQVLSFIVVIIVCLCFTSIAKAASPPKGPKEKTRILFVFDCSYSMLAKWGKSDRMTGAKSILIGLVDSIKNIPNVEMGLRCYGHTSTVADHNCEDTKLEVGFSRGNAKQIISTIKGLQPTGYTPIAYSLSQTANDFPNTIGINIIILITDGIEECDGDPCAVSMKLQTKNITLKPYIVGVGLGIDKAKFFDCVGKYYDAANEKELKAVINNVVGQALGNTTISLELLDGNGKPLETDVAFNLTNSKSAKIEYAYMHSLQSGNKVDTFSVDASLIYNVIVTTVPELKKLKVKLKEGAHNVISIPSPQGNLNIFCKSAREYQTLPIVIRQAGKPEIINTQMNNSSQTYLAGSYTAEVLCLPRYTVKVNIEPGKTLQLNIPEPGRLQLNYNRPVIGSIYKLENGKMIWVLDLTGDTDNSLEAIVLQAGRYMVVYRPATSTNTLDTRDKTFDLPMGGSVVLQIG
ncbi:MAG: VWA domain-containing protein [Bacteroidota bacterium]|nr:VWA domain-containing protein [Bacteroidota bacterium]